MIKVHRGAGFLVPIFGILPALFMHIVSVKLYGDKYYQEHSWPILSVLLFAGILCLVGGLWLQEKRLRDIKKEEGVTWVEFVTPPDHLLRVPLHYLVNRLFSGRPWLWHERLLPFTTTVFDHTWAIADFFGDGST